MKGYSDAQRDRARALRRNDVDAEQRLWRQLRGRSMAGYKFRRQHPIGRYIVDFACLEAGLVIEVDGGQHAEQTAQDEKRTRYIESRGFTVIRFWDTEVLCELEAVLESIRQHFKTPHPNPLPASGERGSD